MPTVTKVLTAHFDGKVIVPDDPVDLPRNQRLTITVESQLDPAHGTAGNLLKHIEPISDDDATEMKKAIDEAFETIDPDPSVNLD
jgi:hypothetical protein